MATIRDIYFPRLFYFSPVYCTKFKDINKMLNFKKKNYIPEILNVSDEAVRCCSLKEIQLAFKKKRHYYIPGVLLDIIIDNIMYMSDIVMDLKKAKTKLHKAYIPPQIPKFRVDV